MRKFDETKEIKDFTKEELIDYSEYVMLEQDKMDWNLINFKKEIIGTKITSIKEFRTFKRQPSIQKDGEIKKRNYRSWIEFFLFEHGSLTMADFEPERFKYIRTHVYEKAFGGWLVRHEPRKAFYNPDTISKANPNIFFEIKGHLGIDADDRGQKYIDIANQTGKKFVFVLQKPGILLPWTVTNPEVLKNGGTGDDLKGQTMEQWCTANGFMYTYYYELKDFLTSKEYADLIINA